MTAKEPRIRITYDPLDELASRFHPDNPKAHDLGAISASIERFGFHTPVLVNDEDGRLIEGHGRVEALLALRASNADPPNGIRVAADGGWLVPAVHGSRLAADEARAFLVAANRTVELGGWDEQRLAALLHDLTSTGVGFDGVGFSEAELAELVEGLGTADAVWQQDPDVLPPEAPDGDVRVRRGQLWRMGRHRLLCGDATVQGDVERLKEGLVVDMFFGDPPYNVDLGAHGGAAARRRRYRPIANDALAPEAFEEFVSAWARHLFSAVSGAVYICMGSRAWPSVARLLSAAGGRLSDTIVWDKQQFTLGRADFQRQHELIWYGWPEGKRHYWCGRRDESDVWSIPRPSISEYHPAQKPVALVERAIANSSPRSGVVLDLFVGSGTTLIAAERLGRRCLAMEIDPLNAQTAIDRWERHTGRKAILEEPS